MSDKDIDEWVEDVEVQLWQQRVEAARRRPPCEDSEDFGLGDVC